MTRAPAHLNGRVQETDDDRARSAAVVLELEALWNCEVHAFPPFSPIDYYASRGRRVDAWLELKCRNVELDAYPSTFLTVRKWLALEVAAAGIGTPALYVVRFVDALRWINVHDVDARDVVIVGDRGVDEHGRNLEPTIRVPIASMRA